MFLLHLPNPFPGAAWTRIGYFAEYFKNKGNEVSIAGIFNPFDKKKFTIQELNGIKILNLIPIMLKKDIVSFLFNIISIIFTSWLPFIITRPEIVIISVPPGESCFVSYILTKIFFVKKVVFDYRDEWEDYVLSDSSSRTNLLFYNIMKVIALKCYKKGNLMITVTEPLVKKLTKLGLKKVYLIPNGADIDTFKPLVEMKNKFRDQIGLKSTDFVLIHSGMIGGYYRIDIAIRAVASLIHKIPNLKLILIGEGHELENILRLIKDLSIEKNIIYLGKTTDKKYLAEIINVSDIGILSFGKNKAALWKNTLPVKSLEYFACGIPLIATVDEQSVLGNIIESNGLGILTKAENIKDISNSIEKAYFSQIIFNDIRNKAPQLIKEQYNRAKTAEEFFNLIQK